MSRRRLSVAEAEQIEYHSLGVKPDIDDQRARDMEELLQMERPKLIERHEAEVAALRAEIEGWAAHASELGDVIRKERRRVDNLYLALFGAVLVILYLYGQAVRCK